MKKLKEMWKDPKGHALLVLGIYVIFFGSIYFYLLLSSNIRNVESTYETPLDKLGKMNSYSYELDMNGETITGTVSNGINTFSYQEIEYTYNEEVPHAEIIYYTNTKNIYNLIHNQEIYSKTEYNDHRISKVYKLDSLEIITTEQNNQINQVEIKTEKESFKITYKIEI